MIYPGRKLMMSSIEIRRDREGILAEVSKEFWKRDLNIFCVLAHTTPEGRGYIFISSEAEGGGSLEDLRESLESIEGIGEVEIQVSEIEGLLIPRALFPLYRIGRRVVLLPDFALKSLIRELIKMIGESSANAILFRVGYEMGKGFGESHLSVGERVGLMDPLDIIINISVPLYASSGYGRVSLEEISDRSISAIVEDNLEASVRERAKQPSCYFTKGLWKGALERIFGKQVSIEEMRCKAAGSDFCEFIVRIEDEK